MSVAPLRVLIVEDSEDDMLLVLRELRRGGFDPQFQRVDSDAAFAAALEQHDWQVILSDYALPGFNGLEALRHLLQTGRDIPFFLISGTVGEEVAVESMRAGATDYLMKQTLTRLVPAIQRELRDAEHRRRRRKAEEELRKHQELLSLIYNHTSEMLGLFRVQPGGGYRMVSVNRSWRDFAARLGLSLTEEQWLRLDLDAVVAQGFPSATVGAEGFHQALTLGQPVSFEEQLASASGPYFTEQSLVPLTDPEGKGRYLMWTCRDRTDHHRAEAQRRSLEQRLVESRKLEALGTMAGGIAHDFNNLLTGMLGYTELAKSDVAGQPHLEEYLAQVLSAGRRARDLIRQILMFSRRQQPLRQCVQLPQVVQEAHLFLRAGIPPHIEVRLDLADTLPSILADSSQLHQVVLNLCTNALYAMGTRPGRLTIGVAPLEITTEQSGEYAPLRPGTHVRLWVDDTGTGMSPEVLARIFEPFYTTKPPGSGTGLGLPVVHGIVQNHEGVIRVRSQPGQGSTFEVVFPAVL